MPASRVVVNTFTALLYIQGLLVKKKTVSVNTPASTGVRRQAAEVGTGAAV